MLINNEYIPSYNLLVNGLPYMVYSLLKNIPPIKIYILQYHAHILIFQLNKKKNKIQQKKKYSKIK